jgi:DNA-binding TFAR19-related protein (PDSD5 family)
MSDDSIQFLERLKAHAGERARLLWETPFGRPAPAKVNLPSEFEIGRKLRATVEEIAACGAELLPFADGALSGRIDQLLDDLRQAATRIAVVGQIKAGKSSFINALTGRPEFLPTHVNPWTAVPTKLYFDVNDQPHAGARFEFFSETEWSRLGQALTGPVTSGDETEGPEAATARTVWRRALIRLGERYHHLLGEQHRYESVTPSVLAHYLCAGPPIDEPSRTLQPGRYADITRLAHIYLPGEPFASPTILIDTPGLNDPTFIRVKTTQNILEYADVYIVILTASQPLAFTDIALLRQLRGLEKRRFLVFINRIDELDGGLADVEAVESHVRAKLRKEFPGASISVTSGSALWANAANDGTDDQLRAIAGSACFRALTGRPSARFDAYFDADMLDDMDALRSLVFEASGFPALTRALSSLMLASFLSADGAAAMNVLNSAAEVSASAARRELKLLRQLIADVKPRDEGVDFHPGIVQLEKRLQGLSQARDRVESLIELSQKKIQTICDTQSAFIRTTVRNIIGAFAQEQKKLLVKQSEAIADTRWRCDTTVLVKRLESEFLDLFSATIREIAAVHDDCIAAVKGTIEQPHSAPDRRLEAHKALRPDIRGALPALGSIIEVEIAQPWWLSWWSSNSNAEEKAGELERKIQREFTPIAERLLNLAQQELTAFAEQARSTIAAVAASTISSTSARLSDLKERLLQHSGQERLKRVEVVNRDYAESIRDLLNVIAKCEAVMDRLRRLDGGRGR